MNRILWNQRPRTPDDGGDIDEIVADNVNVHIEQISDRCWWIGLYADNHRYWTGNFTADSRGRMRFVEQENAGVDWERDDTHETPGEAS